MHETDRRNPQGRRLSQPAAPHEADTNALAAWLEGRLEGEALAHLEARLAGDPALLTLALDADGALGATRPAPQGLLARAGRLVREPGFFRRLFGAGAQGGFRLQPVTLAVTLLAVLAASAAGFELGRVGYAIAAEAIAPPTPAYASLLPDDAF